MIPKIIHQYWAGSPLPEEFAEYRQRWKALHFDWEVYLWDSSPFRLYNRDLYDAAWEISPATPYQFRSDVLRYELLLYYGGVWVDVDFDPQMPIDELCNGCSVWACWEVTDKWVNNAIIGAEPGHPLMEKLVKGLGVNIMRYGPGDDNTLKSGPKYLTPKMLEQRDREQDVVIYPKPFFFPYGWRETHREGEEFPGSYAVHRWNHRRSLLRA